MLQNHPRVGVAVLIVHNGFVLLGERIKEHGFGYWALPGGHLEFGESLEDCAARECLEECGLVLRDIRFYGLTNDIFRESGKHYITVYMQAGAVDASAVVNLEPNKCSGWEWFEWGKLPRPLFLPMENLLLQGLEPPVRV